MFVTIEIVEEGSVEGVEIADVEDVEVEVEGVVEIADVGAAQPQWQARLAHHCNNCLRPLHRPPSFDLATAPVILTGTKRAAEIQTKITN